MRKGNILIPVVAMVGAVVVIGAIVVVAMKTDYIFTKNSNTIKFVHCTADAKLCPDGSSVGRIQPNCDFATCPKANSNSNTSGTFTTGSNTNRAVNSNSSANVNTIVQTTPSSTFSYSTVKVGDRVGGLAVKSVGQFMADRGDIANNHKVTFTGQITVTGTLDARRDGMFNSDMVCMNDFDQTSTALIPKASEDTRSRSFCFSNTPDALLVFPVGTNTQATVVISDFIINDYPSEVLNTTRLVSGNVSTTGWKTYTNTAYSYSLKYPTSWSAPEQNATIAQFGIGDGEPFWIEKVSTYESPDYISGTRKTVTINQHSAFQQEEGGESEYISTYFPQMTGFIRVTYDKTVPNAATVFSTLTFQ